MHSVLSDDERNVYDFGVSGNTPGILLQKKQPCALAAVFWCNWDVMFGMGQIKIEYIIVRLRERGNFMEKRYIDKEVERKNDILFIFNTLRKRGKITDREYSKAVKKLMEGTQ